MQEQTVLKIIDNSGAKTAWCIRILGGFTKKHAKLNNIIIVSIKQLWNKSKKISKVKKKEIYRALIVKTIFKYQNKIGFKKNFKQNAAVLLDKQGNPIGTWILSFISLVLKKKKFQKFLALSKGFI